MSIDLEFEMRQDYLHVKVTGAFGGASIDEACRSFSKILEAVSTYNATKVLVNCFHLKGDPSTLDYYFYGQFIANELIRYRIKGRQLWPQLAYVYQEPSIDKEHFGEMVATNRGANLKSFGNMEDAFHWLGVASTNIKPDHPDTGED